MAIIGIIITGLIVGALARLAIPGPNPMSIPMTIGVGIVGSFLAALIGSVLLGTDALGFLLAVLITAAIVWFLQRGRTTTS